MVTNNHLVGSQHGHVGRTARWPNRQAILGGCSTVIVAAAHHRIWVVVAVRYWSRGDGREEDKSRNDTVDVWGWTEPCHK